MSTDDQRPICVLCGHRHYFEADDAGFDTAETIPWGICVHSPECGCRSPKYAPRAEAPPALAGEGAELIATIVYHGDRITYERPKPVEDAPAPAAPVAGEPCGVCGGEGGYDVEGSDNMDVYRVGCSCCNATGWIEKRPAPAAPECECAGFMTSPCPACDGKPADAPAAETPAERRIAGIVIPPSEQDWDANDALRQQITALHTQLAAVTAERDAAIEDTKDYLQMAKEKDAAIQRAEQLRADLAQARSERDAAHAHACENSIEERHLREQLAQARSALEAARRLSADPFDMPAGQFCGSCGGNRSIIVSVQDGLLAERCVGCGEEELIDRWQPPPQGETTEAPQP